MGLGPFGEAVQGVHRLRLPRPRRQSGLCEPGKEFTGRKHFKACKPRLRLNGEAFLTRTFPERPRGMHRRTYERLKQRRNDAGGRSVSPREEQDPGLCEFSCSSALSLRRFPIDLDNLVSRTKTRALTSLLGSARRCRPQRAYPSSCHCRASHLAYPRRRIPVA